MAITSQASVAAAPSTDAARHHTEFDSSWRSFDGIQGGLAIARMLRVAADASGAEPLAVTAHLDRPVPPGPAELTVGEMRGGRTVSCHVTLTGSGSALVRLARDIGATTMSAPVAEPAPADPSTLPPLEIPVDFVPFASTSTSGRSIPRGRSPVATPLNSTFGSACSQTSISRPKSVPRSFSTRFRPDCSRH